MRVLYAVLLLLLLSFVGVFAVQNSGLITLEFLNWKVTSPCSLLIVLVYLLGMVSGWTVFGVMRRSLRGVIDR
jgi:uncharacterized integral membrane protein